MTSRAFLLIRLGIYLVMTACIEASKTFNDVGAAKLRDYTGTEWAILIIGIGAVALPNVLSFFDTTAGDYRAKNGNNGNGAKPSGNTETIVKATLPLLLLLTILIPGCTLVSANRTFPKLDLYWSADARAQRSERFHAIPSGIAPSSKPQTNSEVKPEYPPYIPPYPGAKP